MHDLVTTTTKEAARFRVRLLFVHFAQEVGARVLPLVLIAIALGALGLFLGTATLLVMLVAALATAALLLYWSWRRAKAQVAMRVRERDLIADLDRFANAAGAIAMANDSNISQSPFHAPIYAKATLALASADLRQWLPQIPRRPLYTFGLVLVAALGLIFAIGIEDQSGNRSVVMAAEELLDQIAQTKSEPARVAEADADQEQAEQASQASEAAKLAAQAEAQTEKPQLGKLVVADDDAQQSAQKQPKEAEQVGNPEAAPNQHPPVNPFEELQEEAAKRVGEAKAAPPMPSGEPSFIRPNREPIKRPTPKAKEYEEIERHITPKTNQGETKTIRAEKEVAALGEGEEANAQRRIDGVPKDAALPQKRVRAGGPLTAEEADFVARWRR